MGKKNKKGGAQQKQHKEQASQDKHEVSIGTDAIEDDQNEQMQEAEPNITPEEKAK